MRWLLLRTVSGVRGDLLHWARVQQDFTMRWIHDNGGPSPAYQSEVERGKKRQVLPKKLAPWITLLNVSEAFATGRIPKYHLKPNACLGLAKEIGPLVKSGRSGLPDWAVLTEQERVREVLKLVIRESTDISLVILAWMLDYEPATVEALLSGQHPIVKTHMQVAATLTMLPEHFFTPTTQLEQYMHVFERAVRQGISPQGLLDLMPPLP